MQKNQSANLCFICFHPWLKKIFTKPPACPRSSRGLSPRRHGRERLRPIVAAVRKAARNQGGKFRNASGSKCPNAAQEMLSLPPLGSCELRGQSALRKRQWEAMRRQC